MLILFSTHTVQLVTNKSLLQLQNKLNYIEYYNISLFNFLRGIALRIFANKREAYLAARAD
jgi:hypothetical protein